MWSPSLEYLSEFLQLDVYAAPEYGAKVTGARADKSQTITPHELAFVLFHQSLDLVQANKGRDYNKISCFDTIPLSSILLDDISTNLLGCFHFLMARH